jgi:hypothetical protein
MPFPRIVDGESFGISDSGLKASSGCVECGGLKAIEARAREGGGGEGGRERGKSW